MYITLYRKYRPQNFEQMSGQKEIVKTIKNSLKNKKTNHAYLFNGPRGVGKTTLARLIAKGVNCLKNDITDEPCNECENCLGINDGSFMDLIEIDAASNRGIDEIRQLKEKVNYQPVKGRKKIYIIDEVHMLTKEAFNALLKTLEEPPEHVIFILATTEIDKILPTIISRCQRYDFKSLTEEEMQKQLEYICKSENISCEEEVFKLIHENANGSMRDAISILERLIIAVENEEITVEHTEKILGITPRKIMDNFLTAMNDKNYNILVKELEKFWSDSIDIESFFKDFAKYVKSLMANSAIDLKFGLRIIDSIYSTFSKFKYEEDKRLIGYVIVDNVLKTEEKTVEKIIEKEIVYEESSIKAPVVENTKKLNLTIDDIKSKWPLISRKIKDIKISIIAFINEKNLYKIENGTLYLAFSYDNQFNKEMMERKEFNETFIGILHEVFNENINVKYILIGQKRDKDENKNDLTQKIADFFGGEIIK